MNFPKQSLSQDMVEVEIKILEIESLELLVPCPMMTNMTSMEMTTDIGKTLEETLTKKMHQYQCQTLISMMNKLNSTIFRKDHKQVMEEEGKVKTIRME